MTSKKNIDDMTDGHEDIDDMWQDVNEELNKIYGQIRLCDDCNVDEYGELDYCSKHKSKETRLLTQKASIGLLDMVKSGIENMDGENGA